MAESDSPETPLIELNDSPGEESDVELLTSLSTTSNAQPGNSNDVSSYFRPLTANNKLSRKKARESTREALQRSTQPSTNEASSNDDIDGLVISPTTRSTSSSSIDSIDESYTLATVFDSTSARNIAHHLELLCGDSNVIPFLDYSSAIPQKGTRFLWTMTAPNYVKFETLESWGAFGALGNMRADKLKDPSADKERQALIKQVNMLVLENQIHRDRRGENAQYAPIHAHELGLFSTFYDAAPGSVLHAEELPNKKAAWLDGFDTKLFAKSVGMVPPGEKPLLVPYRLTDTGEKFEEYCQYPNLYHRKRSAFGTLLEICPLDVPRQPVDEFWAAVNEFFPPLPGRAPSSAYTLARNKPAWYNFKKEAELAAEEQTRVTERPCYIFKDEKFKTFGLYLQDSILANTAEHAVPGKERWWYIKPGRSNEYILAVDTLRQVENLTAEVIDSITKYRGLKGTFQRDEITGVLHWKPSDSEMVDLIIWAKEEKTPDVKEDIEEQLKIAEQTSKELIQEQEEEWKRKEKIQRKREKKRQARKQKTATASTPPIVETAKSDADAVAESPSANDDGLDSDEKSVSGSIDVSSDAAESSTDGTVSVVRENTPDFTSQTSGSAAPRSHTERGRWNTVQRGSQLNRRGRGGFQVGLFQPGVRQHQVMAFPHHDYRPPFRPFTGRPPIRSEIPSQSSPSDKSTFQQLPANVQRLPATPDSAASHNGESPRVFDESDFPAMPSKSTTTPNTFLPPTPKVSEIEDSARSSTVTPSTDSEKEPSVIGESGDESREIACSPAGILPSDPQEIDVYSASAKNLFVLSSEEGAPDSSESRDNVVDVDNDEMGQVTVHANDSPAPTSSAYSVVETSAGVPEILYESSNEQEQVVSEHDLRVTSDAVDVLSSDDAASTPRSSHIIDKTQTELSPQLVSYDDTTLHDEEEYFVNTCKAAEPASEEDSPARVATSTEVIGVHHHLSHVERSDSPPPISQRPQSHVLKRIRPRIDHVYAPESFCCTFCRETFLPLPTKPLFLCPGCGPNLEAPRYCSVECLLVDAYDHSSQCARFPAYARYETPQLPTQYCVYEQNAVQGPSDKQESAEMFRQRTFSLYCRYGSFPKLSSAWCRRNLRYRFASQLCALDEEKLTGVYHIFESGRHRPGLVPNPKANVLYTITLQNGDALKVILSRALHALYAHKESARAKSLAQFVFRAISQIIITPHLFHRWGQQAEPAELVLKEFHSQFFLETGFHSSMDAVGIRPFDLASEANWAMPNLISVEAAHPILLRWAMD